MEVMVAITIMAIIATLAGQAMHTATTSCAATDDAVKRLASVDRTWLLLDTDLRNALPRAIKPPNDELIPALTVGGSSDYWLTVYRGGVANPLHLVRSEEVRVGYRLQEGVLWRDTWISNIETDQRKAQPQKLMTDVKDVVVRVLSDSASSIAAGPWLQDWPAPGISREKLPRALEITLQTEDMGEVKRLFALLPGEDVVFVPKVINAPPGNNNNNNNNAQNNNSQNNNRDMNNPIDNPPPESDGNE